LYDLHIEDCSALMEEWAVTQQDKYDGPVSPRCYAKRCVRSSTLFDEKDLFGQVVLVGGKIRSVGLAGEIRTGLANFLSYSDHNIYGLSRFSKYHLMLKLDGYDLVNSAYATTPGLKYAKESFCPVSKHSMYRVSITSAIERSKGEHMESKPASIDNKAPGHDAAKTVIWTGKDLSAAMGGKWICGAEENVQAVGVWYTLSRIQPGDLFIATNPAHWGEHFTFSGSHEKLQELANRGAVAVVTDQRPVDPPQNLPILLVENTRAALDSLGRYARKRFKGKMICVTGSVGKSSTKEMLRFVLGRQAITSGSGGNQNSVVGVPLSLAQARPDAAYGVFENSAGPKRKVLMIKPHVVIITEIQADHLDVYKTLEGVADAKAQMFDALLPSGTVILNRDNPLYPRLLSTAQTKGVSRIVTFGRHPEANVRAITCRMDATGSYIQAIIHGSSVNYRLAQPGGHMIMNSLAALAAVEAVGADVQQAAADLGKYAGLEQRSKRHRIQMADGYFDLIDDAFSTNPASVRAGMELLGLLLLRPEGRRVVVLGEIKELGEDSAAIHASLANAVLAAKVDRIFTIGDDMLPLRAALPKEMLAAHGNIGTELVAAIVSEVHAGDVILVKGSRRAPENTIPIIKALMAKGSEVAVEESLDLTIAPDDSILLAVSTPERKSDKRKLEILFVGDTDFGESYQTRNEKNGRGNILRDKGYDHPLKNMRRILDQADVVVANLETPLSNLASSPFEGKKGYLHWSDIQQAPEQLLKHNIRMVNLANNHTLDYGPSGLEQTLDVLQRAGIRHFGAGCSAADAHRPMMVEAQVADHSFRMAVVGVFEYRKGYQDKYAWYARDDRAGIASFDDRALQTIRELKQSDPSMLVVVFPHWGQNYQPKAALQVEMADAMLEAGADLILGHGAHALQEIEYRHGRWVIYSIGNFMFNSPGRYRKTGAPPYGLVAKLVVSLEDGVFRSTLRLFPIFTDNRKTGYQSRFVTELEFEEVFGLLTSKDRATSLPMVKGKDEFGSYLELGLGAPGTIPQVPVETKQAISNLAVATSGAVKLAEFVDKEGRFKYRFDALTGVISTGYNVLRHCGSVWAIMDVYQVTPEQDALYQASHRATTYLRNEFLKYVPNCRYACIAEGGVIKLGGNALAILALLAVYSVSKEAILLTISESIGASIERDRMPDGDFVHKTYLATGKISTFRSEYYTGEALLALLALYEASGDGRWLDIVINSENNLMKKYYGVKEQSHWMLYALEGLCRHRWKDAYAQHASQIAQHILTYPEYLLANRSTPTACRSEGLLAFVRLADSSAAGSAFGELRQRSMVAVEHNLVEQCRFRRDDGSFVRGGGDVRNTEVRIDYIQHNISAFLHYHLLTKR
jgi:UDP-N-acetylmuramoyl-tripeptide--D-alanyl-D-alanine ligase